MHNHNDITELAVERVVPRQEQKFTLGPQEQPIKLYFVHYFGYYHYVCAERRLVRPRLYYEPARYFRYTSLDLSSYRPTSLQP